MKEDNITFVNPVYKALNDWLFLQPVETAITELNTIPHKRHIKGLEMS